MTEIEDVFEHLDLTEENQNSWGIKIWTDVEDADNDATKGLLQIMQSDTLGVFKF